MRQFLFVLSTMEETSGWYREKRKEGFSEEMTF